VLPRCRADAMCSTDGLNRPPVVKTRRADGK
jgi:hypothetical protein